MRTMKLTILALALAGAFPTRAFAQANDTKKAALAVQPSTAGMTAEQQAEFNRIAVKTEALEDSRDALGFKGLKISGYMDPTYIYNFNKQRGTFQFIVPGTGEVYGYDNSYFGTVSLDIVKETDNGTKFHLNLIPKRGTGDFNDSSIVNEASVWVPLGGLDTKFFAGQLPDWSGYEYQAPTMYKNVTHNLLFDFTLPYFYTGAGIELIRGKLDLKLMLANFNQSIRQIGESVPMFVFRGDYSAAEYWGWGFAGAAGYKNNFRPIYGTTTNPITNEAYSTKDTLYLTGELDCYYTRADVTFNAHVVYGQQDKAAITADPTTGNLRTSQWAGLSVLGAYKFTQRLEGSLRADFLYNQKNGGGLMDWTTTDAVNGIGPDQNGGDQEKGANKYAVTAGLDYAFNSNVVFKFEARYDGATQNVFGNKDALTGGPDPKYIKNNTLLGTAVVFSF
jgi:hypothetical protein